MQGDQSRRDVQGRERGGGLRSTPERSCRGSSPEGTCRGERGEEV